MQNKSHPGRFRHIHAYSGIFRHIQTYPKTRWHIQDQRHIQNPGLPWDIQNRRHTEKHTQNLQWSSLRNS